MMTQGPKDAPTDHTRIRVGGSLLAAVCLLLATLPALSGPGAHGAAVSQKGEKEDHPIDRRLDACMEKAGSTAAMVACVDRAQREWDADLNAGYQRLLKLLPAKGQTELKESQRAWIAFRDRELKVLRTFYEGRQGTMYVPMAAESAMRLTKDRALQIDGVLVVYDIDKKN